MDNEENNRSGRKNATKILVITLMVIIIILLIALIAVILSNNKQPSAAEMQTQPSQITTETEEQATTTVQETTTIKATEEETTTETATEETTTEKTTAATTTEKKVDDTECVMTQNLFGIEFKIPTRWEADASENNMISDDGLNWCSYSPLYGAPEREIAITSFPIKDTDDYFSSKLYIEALTESFVSESLLKPDTIVQTERTVANLPSKTISGVLNGEPDCMGSFSFFTDGTNYYVLQTLSLKKDESWNNEVHKNILNSVKTVNPEAASVKAQEKEEESDVDLSDNVVTENYMYVEDDYSDFTYGVTIVTNNNDVDVAVTGQGKFLDSGHTVSVKDDEIMVLGPEQSSILWFVTEAKADEFTCDIQVSESDYYRDVIRHIDYFAEKVDDRAIVSVSNTGNYPAEFVEGYVLFFNQGNLVDSDWIYYVDDDYELKPGETMTQELQSTQDFDSIKVYFKGRAEKDEN